MNELLNTLNDDLTLIFQKQKQLSGRELLKKNLIFRTDNNGLYIFEKGDKVYWFTSSDDFQLKMNPNNMTFVYQKSVDIGKIRKNYTNVTYN